MVLQLLEVTWSVCQVCEWAVTTGVQHEVHQYAAAWTHWAAVKSTGLNARSITNQRRNLGPFH